MGRDVLLKRPLTLNRCVFSIEHSKTQRMIKMKLSRTISLTLSFLTLTLFAGSIQASPMFHAIDEDYHIRLVVPEENAEKLSLTYPINGDELTVPLQDGEIVSLSINDGNLEKLAIPFTAYQNADEYVIDVGDPDPMNSLNPVIGFHSTLEAAGIEKEPTLTFTAPGGKMEVVYAPGSPQEGIAPVGEWPMTIDETFKVFSLDGTLDIKIFVKPSVEGDGNDGDKNAQEDAGLQDDLVEGPASGGCSLVAATGSSSVLMGIFTFALAGLFALRRKHK